MGDVQNLFTLPVLNLNKMGILRAEKIPIILFLIISIQITMATFHLILMLLQFFYMGNNIEPYVENIEGVVVFVQVKT